ncbi:MAG: hypothetical protein SVY53_11220 [Chloroflexota bacterium]|nr:hypothetical protein [Chloroflexota bacterium]
MTENAVINRDRRIIESEAIKDWRQLEDQLDQIEGVSHYDESQREDLLRRRYSRDLEIMKDLEKNLKDVKDKYGEKGVVAVLGHH